MREEGGSDERDQKQWVTIGKVAQHIVPISRPVTALPLARRPRMGEGGRKRIEWVEVEIEHHTQQEKGGLAFPLAIRLPRASSLAALFR